MAGIARPFIPWIGSKEKLIPYIWQVFPPTPKLYLEPFGGGGALLLGMQPKVSRMDIYNDFTTRKNQPAEPVYQLQPAWA